MDMLKVGCEAVIVHVEVQLSKTAQSAVLPAVATASDVRTLAG